MLKDITTIQKRDGRKVKFNPKSITQAMLKAFMVTHEVDGEKKSLIEAQRLTPIAVDLFKRTINGQIPSVETMQDVVEKVLMAAGHYKTAKAYILYRAEHKERRKIEQLLGVKDDLGLNLNQLKVLERRYLRHNEEGKIIESPRQMFQRVAKAVAANEKKNTTKWQEFFFKITSKMEFLPAGCYLRSAGTKRQMLANCFVLPVEDSMEGIFNAVKWMAQVHQKGGGTGFNFSKLRPKGDFVVSSGGYSSGPISFMKVFDAATRQVMQGGFKRGANMGILNIDHPDILDFITCKTEENEISNFNISLGITDKFMQAVEKDKDFKLINQRTGELVQKVNARSLFEQIATLAWRTGDPGMIYLDAINRANPVLKTLGPMVATNPCIAGNMLVSSNKGLEAMATLKADGQAKAMVDKRVIGQLFGIKPETIKAFYDQGKKQTLRVITRAGFELVCTPDHKIMTTNGWKAANKLTLQDKLLLQSQEGAFLKKLKLPINSKKESFPTKWSQELGQVIGWLVGDGWLRTGDKNCRVGFVFSKKDRQLLQYFKPILNSWYGHKIKEVKRERDVYHLSYHGQFFVDFFKNLGILPVKSQDKQVPFSLFTAPRKAVIGFLQGLFTADGTVGINHQKGNYYIRLTAKSKKLLNQVQLLLINLGIKANLYDRSRPERNGFAYINIQGKKTFYRLDGKLWELNISKSNLKKFVKKVGFLEKKHQNKLNQLKGIRFKKEHYYDSVAKVIKNGQAKVYDITVSVSHSFIANGIVVSNCGEQPLHPFDVCNLGSINLAKFVKHKNKKDNLKDFYQQNISDISQLDKRIDYSRLAKVTCLAVRFLDNGVDVSNYPIEQIANMAKANRRIGLGVMGWADMLYQLAVPYNFQVGLKLAKKVMKFISNTAHKESEKLAKEKGVFPNWKGSQFEKQKIKRRNIAITTIAPTGTISMVANCSSGIEPVFALSFVKNVVDEQGLTYVNPYFAQALEAVVKDEVRRQEILDEVAKTGSCQKIIGLPRWLKDVFVTAHDISWQDHVKTQAAFQKYTDNAVSKTINFSHDAGIKEVFEAFILAWKLGCKGITIYRDGSKSVQVLKNQDKEKPIAEPMIQSKLQTTSLRQRIKKNFRQIINNKKQFSQCPECGGTLQVAEGCSTCLECGYSKCSL